MASRAFIIAACALAAVLVPAATADKRVDVGGGFYVDVKGQSGKIEVGTTGNTTSRVVVDFDSMKERDADGNAVGSGTSPVTHGFNSFASQDFVFSTTQEVVFRGVPAVNFNFTADLQTSAKLTVQTYLFKEAGTIDIGINETMDVKRGTLKFNVEIRDWIFCDASATSGEPAYCKKGNSKQTGAWLDLEIEVKGKANNATLITQAQEREQREQQERQRQQQQQQQQQQRPTRRHVPDEYSLGDGAVFGASTQVDNNGVWEPMADGYPKTVSKNQKTAFIFRFPKFDNPGYVFYDPSITLDAEGEGGTNGAGKSALSLLVIAAAAVLAMLGDMAA